MGAGGPAATPGMRQERPKPEKRQETPPYGKPVLNTALDSHWARALCSRVPTGGRPLPPLRNGPGFDSDLRHPTLPFGDDIWSPVSFGSRILRPTKLRRL